MMIPVTVSGRGFGFVKTRIVFENHRVDVGEQREDCSRVDLQNAAGLILRMDVASLHCLEIKRKLAIERLSVMKRMTLAR